MIVTLAKGVKAFRDIYEKSVALYYSNENRQDQDASSEIQEEKDAIVASLKQPGLSDAQKRTFRKRLIALSRQ